jgi:hypothetical protein
MRAEAKLTELGFELPPTPTPAANYVGAVQTGNLALCVGAWADERWAIYLHRQGGAGPER